MAVVELSVPFEYDANVQVLDTTNNDTYTVHLDGELVSDEFTTYYVSRGQTLLFKMTPTDALQEQTVTLETKFI